MNVLYCFSFFLSLECTYLIFSCGLTIECFFVRDNLNFFHAV